jgi:AcrR family transcriptional regulator
VRFRESAGRRPSLQLLWVVLAGWLKPANAPETLFLALTKSRTSLGLTPSSVAPLAEPSLPPTEPPLGRRERKKAATRQAILDTGLRLFAERGFSQTTVAAIAEAADVSDSTVFFHFASKDDLLFDHVLSRASTFAGALAAREPGQSTQEVIRRYLEDARDAPESIVEQRILMSRIIALEPNLIAGASECWGGIVRPALLAAFADEFQDSPVTVPEILTGVTIGLTQELGRLQSAQPHRRDLFAHFLDLAMNSLAVVAASLTNKPA